VSRSPVAQQLILPLARSLKMPGLGRQFEALARQAREEKWSYEEFLHEALSAESSSRHEAAIRIRIHDARFPETKTLDDFDLAATDGAVTAQQLAELGRCTWVEQASNVILAGPIGTGKTHLAIALGIEAAKQRKRVAFHRAADIVRVLLEARDQRELTRLHRRLRSVDLLIIDELGFVPFDRTGGELLFNLLSERYERRSVLVTTNLAFAEWIKVFGGDEKLTTALLDRLAHHATVITTKGKSYRMRKRLPAVAENETTLPKSARKA